MSRSEEPRTLTLRTDYTDDGVNHEVENNDGYVTVCERLREVVVADESRGTVVAFAISRSIIEGARGTLEAIRREEEMTCVRIELPRFNSSHARQLKSIWGP